ncbi:hypothetical protein SAMN02910353_02570 [Ruminococcus sp. YRD2003]|uniref:hypothetical protein n=1 Tax=Ruminococcus sp. YRD2003 TaxID=1452313 RepID=UPI0008AC7CC0|nr:hypothetical protein SAMN02910353_02570 [Ruminococcus flavefaciens]
MGGILLSFAIGLIIACIVVLPKLSELKTVHMKNSASDYTVKDSMRFTENRDTFLSTKVEKTPRNTQTSSQR